MAINWQVVTERLVLLALLALSFVEGSLVEGSNAEVCRSDTRSTYRFIF